MASHAQRSLLVLLLIAAILLVAVIKPLAAPLILAAVLAGVLQPLQRRLATRLGGRRSLASGALVAAVVVVLVGPVAGLSATVAREAAGGISWVSQTIRSEGVAGLLDRLPTPVAKLARAVLLDDSQAEEGALTNALREQFSAQTGSAANVVGSVLGATGAFLFQSAMMLIALYAFLLSGAELVAWLDEAAPLRPGQVRELLSEFRKVSYAVVISSVATSAIQAVAALIGYSIAGVPRPVFFAGVTFVTAFIPAIGAASVCLAAAALLYLTGHPYMALFLTGWGLLVVGLVDNLVKPLLIRSGMAMNGAVVFFALIGGLAAFGPIGLLLGPLVVSLFVTLVRIYRRDYPPPAAERPALRP